MGSTLGSSCFDCAQIVHTRVPLSPISEFEAKAGR